MTASRSRTGRAIIIGGSMAGLFSAVCLRKFGWDVAVYERASGELANRGAGIATHDELYDAVRAAGIELREEMGVKSVGRIMFDPDGRELTRCEMPQIMTSWGLIYRFLRTRVPDEVYFHDRTLERIEQSADAVTAHFADGSSDRGDWLIGADGTRSTVRSLVAPQVKPIYCGYLGWRGLIDETLIPEAVLEQVAYRMAFSMAPGGHWLGYLVAGPGDALTPGSRWYNWGWYRTADADALRDHLTDSDGRYYPDGIPHTLIRDEIVHAMRTEAERHLAPQVQAIISATAQPFIQGMYDFGVERMRYDRVFLAGDAAFTARPHVGLGVSKAADDASKLAAALSAADQAAALEQWENERLQFGRAALQWGRDLGSYIGPPPSDEAGRKKAAHYMQPEVLTTVTAANDPHRYLATLTTPP